MAATLPEFAAISGRSTLWTSSTLAANIGKHEDTRTVRRKRPAGHPPFLLGRRKVAV
jgi:hypothetical protein